MLCPILEIDQQAARSLAAGLVIVGVWMLCRGRKQEAIDAFRKAEVSSQGSSNILIKIVVELIANGLDAERKALMARLPDELKDSYEIVYAEMEFLMRQPEKEGVALKLAQDLILGGKADARIYEFVIKKFVGSGRKSERILELVDEARTKFPYEAERFKTYLN